MDLLSYWRAVTLKNSAEKCIMGITGEKNWNMNMGGHRKFVVWITIVLSLLY